MTGTSVDGIDISLVKTNGINIERQNENYFYKFNSRIRNLFLNVLSEDIKTNLRKKKYLDEVVTEEHYKALKGLKILDKCDLIGFHGQTIYHNPSEKVSIQLGNPQKLAKLLNKDVMFDFRLSDLKNGGQGAPLAPIYHKLIIESLNLELPSCILNIGGVANLTYWDGEKLIGFDTGPGNALMDNYIREISDNYFDDKGILASQGIPDKQILKKFINHDYFKKIPPKSLDKNTFIDFYNYLLSEKMTPPDTMATLALFTLEAIFISLKFLPNKIKSVLVTGGGYKNKFLMSLLKEKINANFVQEKDTDVDFNYLESELIAFLSARSIYNLPFTFPSTTGVKKPSSGGKVYNTL